MGVPSYCEHVKLNDSMTPIRSRFFEYGEFNQNYIFYGCSQALTKQANLLELNYLCNYDMMPSCMMVKQKKVTHISLSNEIHWLS